MRYVGLGALALALVLGSVGSPAAGAAAGDASWYRVQFARSISDADRTALEGAGAETPLYAPENAHVAWLDPAAVTGARSIATVTSVRPLGRADKIAHGLADGAGLLRISALVHGGSVDQVRTRLEALGDVAAVGADAASPSGLAEVLLTVAAADLPALADVPAVLYVGRAPTGLHPEDEGTAQIVAGNLDYAGARPVPGYESWLSSVGLDGSGVKVSIVDTGVDEKHPDLSGRVEKRIDYTPVPEPEDTFGHGTHVGGIVAGNGTALRQLGGATDLDGFLYGLGVAPGARLLDQNAIGTSVQDWPPPYGFAQITTDALAAGATVWNASWHTGEGTGAGYIEIDADDGRSRARRPTVHGRRRAVHDGLLGRQRRARARDADRRRTRRRTSSASRARARIAAAGSIDEVSAFSSSRAGT